MTARKFFLRRLRQPALPERIETEPDLPPEDAALGRALLTLAQAVQPDQEFVARLEGDLSRRRPTARPAIQEKPSFIERIRHAMQTTWGWALPAGAVIVLILVISLLVQMRPRQNYPIRSDASHGFPAVNTTDTPIPSAETTYIVQEGDTLLGIAAYYGVTVDAIFEANHMQSGDVLRPGMSLIIPQSKLATRTPASATQALLAELQDLVARRRAELLSGPGWIYLKFHSSTSGDCGAVILPNGLFQPCEIDQYEWSELNARGEVITTITRQLDPSGNIFQEYVTQDGLTRNLTFGYESTATLTSTYGTDWGFAAYTAQAVKSGASLVINPPSVAESPGSQYSYQVLVDGILQREAAFNAQSGALQQVVIYLPNSRGQDNHEIVTILTEERVAQPPADALALLDQPLQPSQPQTPASTVDPTPVPAGMFPLLFYPPAVMVYDNALWSDYSKYTDTSSMVNYLQARSLDTCQIGPAGPSGNYPSPDEIVTLGSVRYQVTTYPDMPPGSTTADYIDTGSLAGYPYLQNGVIVLTVRASAAQWEACKALAEGVLSSLQVEDRQTIPPAAQVLLAELQSMVSKRRAELLSGPGWLYVHVKYVTSTNCGWLLPNGAINPCELDQHTWYELNAQGQVVTVITRSIDRSGAIYGETVTHDGLIRYLSMGYELLAPLTTTYETDLGFVTRAAAAAASGVSFTLLADPSNGASTEHVLYSLDIQGEGKQDAMFNPQTGALQSLVTWKPAPFNGEINASQFILAEQRVDQPPADILALLDQPLQPYQPLPPQGDPVPAGFDLAGSTLSKRSIYGDDMNSPSFFYGDIYADGIYLVGRVDLGADPGGDCRRSPDGLKLAFKHLTLSDQGSPTQQQVRWLALNSPADVHAGPPDLQVVSPPAWGPDSTRLAFIACDANQSCGLYTYDTLSGALQRLADGGGAAYPPVWSPDGTEIAYQTGSDGAPQTVVVDAASGVVNAAPTWQPQFPDWDGFNQCAQPPALVPTLPPAPADWLTYTNTTYGFSFRYPSNWTLEEDANSVQLKQGDLQISIHFSHAEENISGGWRDAEGDFVHSGRVSFFGLSLARFRLVYQDKVKGVSYSLGVQIPRGDVLFGISLDDWGQEYEAVDLSAEAQQTMNQIVESFGWLP